jgi:hypothetical protein
VAANGCTATAIMKRLVFSSVGRKDNYSILRRRSRAFSTGYGSGQKHQDMATNAFCPLLVVKKLVIGHFAVSFCPVIAVRNFRASF